MRLLRGDAPPDRLLAMFVLLTGLPLLALAWLGARVLDQDRALASQRRLERLQNAANELADALETATRGSATELARGVGLPNGRTLVTVLRFDGRRLVERRGAPLLYYPDGVTPPDVPADVFATIEDAELANPVLAIEQYTRLTASIDAAVRAGAYVRLARVQLRNNRTREALGTYEALLALGGPQSRLCRWRQAEDPRSRIRQHPGARRRRRSQGSRLEP